MPRAATLLAILCAAITLIAATGILLSIVGLEARTIAAFEGLEARTSAAIAGLGVRLDGLATSLRGIEESVITIDVAARLEECAPKTALFAITLDLQRVSGHLQCSWGYTDERPVQGMSGGAVVDSRCGVLGITERRSVHGLGGRFVRLTHSLQEWAARAVSGTPSA